jgi:hypothetical protein
VVASERYYAERSPDSTRERVRHTLRLLAELKRATGGKLSIRLASHPLAMGVISVDDSRESRSDALAMFHRRCAWHALPPGVRGHEKVPTVP